MCPSLHCLCARHAVFCASAIKSAKGLFSSESYGSAQAKVISGQSGVRAAQCLLAQRRFAAQVACNGYVLELRRAPFSYTRWRTCTCERCAAAARRSALSAFRTCCDATFRYCRYDMPALRQYELMVSREARAADLESLRERARGVASGNNNKKKCTGNS